MAKNTDALYLGAKIHKVKSNKAITFALTVKQATDFRDKILDLEGFEYYVKIFNEAIEYAAKEELKNCYIYISSKYKLQCMDEDGYIEAVNIPAKSKVTLKFENGFVNAIRVDEKYNPLKEF